MRTGQLRHRVEIQQIQVMGTTELGTPIEAWTTIARRYANIESLADDEIFQAGQKRTRANFRIVMRYYPLTPKMRIKWANRIFNLVPADNPGERGRGTEMQVMAVEEV